MTPATRARVVHEVYLWTLTVGSMAALSAVLIALDRWLH
jgi:hypothetical protein